MSTESGERAAVEARAGRFLHGLYRGAEAAAQLWWLLGESR